MVATGCDKKDAGPALAARPPVLFQVFGAKEDPRVVPIAFVDSAGPRAMELTPPQWREFDSLYTRGGDSLYVYWQGRVTGSARIARGMWETGQPLYTLPGCDSPVPQASVNVAADAPIGNVVELLATSSTLRTDTLLASRSVAIGPPAVVGIARVLGAREARRLEVSPAAIDSLDFRALAANTGSTTSPTVVASFVDPSAGDGGRKPVRHVLLVADRVNDEWVVTYSNAHASAGRDDALQRYVDRIDLTGDGVAEIVLEEWTLGGGARPVVLRWRDGKWQELWRGRADWCAKK